MVQCNYCSQRSAVLKRPKTGEKICKECFFVQFELEVHQTIVGNALFSRGERVAIAASGGKDSTVLAHVLTKLNRAHDYGLNLFLLSIDEGITGYRDDSLESVKRNQSDYDVPLLIVGYKELYGWSMDEIVAAIGLKNSQEIKTMNCTFCGVFRRQALDRGAVLLKADKICTGHNADDMAETVLMNLLRGDIARLQRCTHITTGRGTDSTLPRCKPFKYCYEKEIVMYAYYAGLDYFSTECIYSPNAYRGFARELLKELEAVKPRAIVDIVRSGEHFLAQQDAEEDRIAREPSSTASAASFSSASAAAAATSSAAAVAATPAASAAASSVHASVRPVPASAAAAPALSRDVSTSSLGSAASGRTKGPTARSKPLPSLGSCERCNYISSNRVCKACVLLEGLNKGRPKIALHATPEQAAALQLPPAKPVGMYISDGREAESMAGRVASIHMQQAAKGAAATAAAPASASSSAPAAAAAASPSADAASAASSSLSAVAAASARPPVKLSAAMDMAQKKNATDW